jgi:hypothetical protein
MISSMKNIMPVLLPVYQSHHHLTSVIMNTQLLCVNHKWETVNLNKSSCIFIYMAVFDSLTYILTHLKISFYPVILIPYGYRGRRYRMEVGFTTACAISAYHH